MKSILDPAKDIAKVAVNLLEATYHGSRAMKIYCLAQRIKAEAKLYELLQNKQALTQDQQIELKELIKEYKKTLRQYGLTHEKTTKSKQTNDGIIGNTE